MPAEYFEARERALLGERHDTLYAAPQETAARGVTVSALRTTPEGFAARADFPLRPSPFCKAAFVVEQPDFKPGRHPYHHAGVFYSQEPSASSAAPLLGVKPGMRVLDLCAAPGGKSSQLAAALQDAFGGSTFGFDGLFADEKTDVGYLEKSCGQKAALDFFCFWYAELSVYLFCGHPIFQCRHGNGVAVLGAFADFGGCVLQGKALAS